MNQRNIITLFFGVIFVIIMFSMLIYPTPYRYMEYDNQYPLKVNWITGKTWVFLPGEGWVEK